MGKVKSRLPTYKERIVAKKVIRSRDFKSRDRPNKVLKESNKCLFCEDDRCEVHETVTFLHLKSPDYEKYKLGYYKTVCYATNDFFKKAERHDDRECGSCYDEWDNTTKDPKKLEEYKKNKEEFGLLKYEYSVGYNKCRKDYICKRCFKEESNDFLMGSDYLWEIPKILL